MILTSQPPVYGKNYGIGYLGGTYHSDHFLSHGIAYFTRWERMSAIPITHVFIVTGPNQCIEATKEKGVYYGTLQDRFSDDHCLIAFRKPVNLRETKARRIAWAMEDLVGAPYDTRLIKAHMLNGMLTGKLIGMLTRKRSEALLCSLLKTTGAWICANSCAHAIAAEPDYTNKGILAEPHDTISPQELFGDESGELFEPWKEQR